MGSPTESVSHLTAEAVLQVARRQKPLLLRWRKMSIVEGANGKLKLTVKRAFGFSTYGAIEIDLDHTLGDLPEPKWTHRFC